MNRNLDKNRHQLSDYEKEHLWQALRRDFHGRPAERPRPRVLGRALSAAAATCALVLAGLWWSGDAARTQAPAARDRQPLSESLAAAPAPAAAPTAEKSGRRTEAARVAVVDTVLQGAVLSGRIVDRQTGEPLAHASILIRGTDRGLTTDAAGRFRLENLEPGRELTLEVKFLGYEPEVATVTGGASGARDLTFRLEPVVVAALDAVESEAKTPVVQHTVNPQTFDKYKVESVQEALSKQAGVVRRAGELDVRGESAGQIARPAPGPDKGGRLAAPGWDGSVTGGTTPPNGERVELMYFDHTGVNPFVPTEEDSLSTFAVDVDNASWTVVRNYLNRGMLPPSDAVRVEEFVNAFDAGWPAQTDETFQVQLDGASSRFGEGYRLLRIGLVGKTVAAEHRRPANLIFVIDISGSMNRENRLGLVKRALHVLLGELQEGDTVGLVVYGSRGEVRLQPTDISQREAIAAAIDGVRAGGSTNAAEGLELAYRMAREHYQADTVNRIILCSDGVANTGSSTEAGGILDRVRHASDQGITLSTIGFGMGNYNDVLMEQLADSGDGNYYYVDAFKEAERVFRENLTGLLQTIAREAKVQVEFDPRTVRRWRLLGYENRDVADRDFRNDAVDAGEVGAGHQVTALYELKLMPQVAPATIGRVAEGPALRLGEVRLRWEAPAHESAAAGQVTEIARTIGLNDLGGDFGAAGVRLRVQAVVAEFAEILRGSYWARESSLGDLAAIAAGLAAELPQDPAVRELADLIATAADLQAAADDGE